MKKISAEKVHIAKSLLRQGVSKRSIAAGIGVKHSMVSKIRGELKKNGEELPTATTGRPGILTERDARKAVRLVVAGTCSNAIQVKRKMEADPAVPSVSVSTYRRALYRAGYHGRVKRKKPLLKKTHRQRRLAFAKAHSQWTVDQWKPVIWSDESKFNVFGSDGRQYCWRKPGESIRDGHVQTTVKHGGGSVMVWGCMTWDGVGFLCKIDGIMNSATYQAILGNELMPTMDFYGLSKSDIMFQHDNDPKHASNSTKEWLEDNKIPVLPWPAQSPDMNPIEHLWNELDRRIRSRPELPTSASDLWEIMQDEWKKIPPEFCRKLISTMPERVNDLKNARGGYTRW